MLTRKLALLSTLVAAHGAAALPAQDLQPDPHAALDAAARRAAQLSSVAFSTIESQDNSMTRQFRAQMPTDGEIEIEGVRTADVLYASINVEEDEVAFHRGNMVARSENGAWKRRHQALAGGGDVPFVFDPRRFFAAFSEIAAADRQVARSERLSYRNQQYDVFSVTLENDAAKDFVFTGAIPKVSGPRMMMMRRMPGMMGGGTPETTIDLAFYVHPDTGHVHRIRAKAYQESSMPPGVQVRFGGPGGEDVAEDAAHTEEVEEVDAEGKRIYKRGLPVRNVGDDLSVLDFDVKLTDHGSSSPPELDDDARRLLRMQSGK